MVSSGRQAIACILLIACIAICSPAQTAPVKQSTASVSGKVTLKGKGVPGIVVMATENDYRGVGNKPIFRATTDESGNYRISNVPQGKYQIYPRAFAYALEGDHATNPVNIEEGETVEDLNFALRRGGVITGKVTDADGQPLIELPISFTIQVDQNVISSTHGQVVTDDRGIYRAFALRAGKYKVFAGSEGYRLPGPGRQAPFAQTFYPSTTDEAKATEIDVTEGSEIKDIDIVVAIRREKGFKVTGQIVDGQTGKPLPNITYGVRQYYEGGSHSTTGPRSNANGEFRFESLLPGKYAVFIQPELSTEMRANPVRFEVTDSDITGLVLKAVRGAALSGVVVLEGVDEKSVSKKLSELYVSANVSAPVENPDEDDLHNAMATLVKPDGTFKVSGLRGGTAQVSVTAVGRSNGQEMVLIRIERDGVVQSNGIGIKETEHIQGLRLIVRHSTGAIRGQVKIEGGELPRSTHMYISIQTVGDGSERSYRSEQIDSRGRFYVEGLAAGKYEVKLNAFGPGVVTGTDEMKQEVSVTDNTVSEVVLTLKLKNAP